MADETTTGQGGQDQTAGTGATGTDEALTLTKAELAVQLQKEGDRRVAQAEAKIQERAEKAAAEKIAAERAAQEEALLKEQGKWQTIAEKQAAENERLKAGIEASKLLATTHSLCSEKGLPEFAKVFEGNLGTVEGRGAFLDTAKGLIDAKVEALVAERLRTDAPDKGANTKPTGGNEAWKDFYAKTTP
jgi:translation initiation factor 4G